MAAPTRSTTPSRVGSRDGTPIAYWACGDGPPLVFVHGTTSNHTTWDPLLPHLEPQVTAVTLDRRGRGDSGDGPDYDIEREYEDVAAVIDAVAASSGMPVDLFGHSFGGLVAIGAATRTRNLRRLALYEGWPLAETAPPVIPSHVTEQVERQLAAGDDEAALEAFYRHIMPEEQLQAFRASPAWQARVTAAPTIPREEHAVREARLDTSQLADITSPVLLMVGSDTPDDLKGDPEAVAASLSDARIAILDGQQHLAYQAAPAAFADTLLTFLHA